MSVDPSHNGAPHVRRAPRRPERSTLYQTLFRFWRPPAGVTVARQASLPGPKGQVYYGASQRFNEERIAILHRFFAVSLAVCVLWAIPAQVHGQDGSETPAPAATPAAGDPAPAPQPSAAPLVSLAAPSAAGPGAFAVVAEVARVENLGAFDVRIAYDTRLLEFVSARVLEFLGGTGREVQCSETKAQGLVQYSCLTLGNRPPTGPSGDGPLAELLFRPKADGAAMLEVAFVKLVMPDGTLILADAGETIQVEVTAPDSGRAAWQYAAAAVAALGLAGVVGGGLWVRRSKRS